MERKRKVYAPFSQTSEAGVTQTPVEGYIDVNQTIYPTVSTGVVNEKGQWSGVKSSDTEFIGLSKAVAVPNTAEVLFPDSNDFPSIDMTGFKDIFIAFKSSRAGQIGLIAKMGPDTLPFANLSPVNAASTLKMAGTGSTEQTGFNSIIQDSNETLVADVWEIFYIQNRAKDQKNMQFKMTNSTGGEMTTVEFAFMRLV